MDRVTHCICTDTPLAALVTYPDVVTVRRETGCGDHCGLCLPYIAKLLAPRSHRDSPGTPSLKPSPEPV